MDLFLQSSYSRRTFLKQTVAIGAAGFTVSGLLTACGNEQAADTKIGPTDQTSPGATVSGKCQGSTELEAADVAARQAVNYEEESPYADKFCANCRFFKPPVTGAVCGRCEIVKGPIAAEGYCNAWVMQS